MSSASNSEEDTGSEVDQHQSQNHQQRHDSNHGGVLRDQDRFLPITNLVRIMKKNLPPDAKISKDSKECIQEIASEFISFVTSEAADVCAEQKRKTVNGDDIFTAMERLGFDKYLEPLREFFNNKRALDDEGGDDADSDSAALSNDDLEQ